MRILSISTYQYIKPTDGGRNGIYYQHKSLANKASLMVAGVQANEEDAELNYPLYPIFSNSKYRYINPRHIFTISKLAKTNNTDVILLQHPYLGWIIPALKFLTKCKFAIRSHNVEYLRFKDLGKKWWPILKAYEKWVHNQADYLLCVTEEDKAFFSKQGIKSKLIDLPYGTILGAYPSNKLVHKQAICKQHNLDEHKKIILYNGSLGYLPNCVGLEILIKEVYPELLKHTKDFNIVICGGGLKDGFDDLKNNKYPNITYCGFVDDINPYFLAADIFVNPVQGGGGIKTKLIESIAFGCTCVSSADGAKGLVQSTCPAKLIISKDYDGADMAQKILPLLAQSHLPETPTSYYNYYNWDKIMERVVQEMQ
jgi:polysaccharide biosynthesis protein PslH